MVHWVHQCLFTGTPGVLVHLVQVHWFAGSLVHWCTGALVHWCTDSLVHWFTGALVHWFTWCTGSLVHWFPGALVHWCSGALVHLVHWCTGSPGALVQWCTGSPGAPVHWFHRCTGSLVHQCTSSLVSQWFTGSLVYWFTFLLQYKQVLWYMMTFCHSCTCIWVLINSSLSIHDLYNNVSSQINQNNHHPAKRILDRDQGYVIGAVDVCLCADHVVT